MTTCYQPGDHVEYRTSDPACASGWRPGIVDRVLRENGHGRGLSIRIRVCPGVWVIRPIQTVRHAS
jgi:hypothetical protein